MQMKNETNSVSNLWFFAFFSSLILAGIALSVYFFLPENEPVITETEPAVASTEEENRESLFDENLINPLFQDLYAEYKLASANDSDLGLKLYRQPLSRAAVEWFYFQIAGNKEVSDAILEAADNNNIPLALAFSLAHTESNYNVKAVHKNSNDTIDRGLFQLNSNSFTKLTEEDFFNPQISSKYGMSHLRFCIDTAGNEVAGLAMYNAGTNKVRSNKTPQVTLNYVGSILEYQKMLDELFEDQVAVYFETQIIPQMTVAYADIRR